MESFSFEDYRPIGIRISIYRNGIIIMIMLSCAWGSKAVKFKIPMPLQSRFTHSRPVGSEPELTAAQKNRSLQGGSAHIFDHIRHARSLKFLACRFDQVGVSMQPIRTKPLR